MLDLICNKPIRVDMLKAVELKIFENLAMNFWISQFPSLRTMIPR